MNGEKDVCGLIGRVRTKLRTGSLLWRYLLMITSVLLLALLALTIISKISIDRLKNEKISEMRMTLERDAGGWKQTCSASGPSRQGSRPATIMR